ncbi:LLM class flavin-dependent oxidoreductase [Streptomyces kaempferi]
MTSMTPRFRLGFLTHVQGRGDDLARTYRNAQELFVVADELGFDTGWVAQHHVQAGGGGLSSPWTFLAHAAARTTRIRLGTAITVLPLEDPVRLAEDVAVVDTLSGGRVEIGVGSGYSDTEYAAFGQDVARKRELTSEKLSELRRALSDEEVRTPGFRIQRRPATSRTGSGRGSSAAPAHGTPPRAARTSCSTVRRTASTPPPTRCSAPGRTRSSTPGTGRASHGSGCPGSCSPRRTDARRFSRSATTSTGRPFATRRAAPSPRA